MKRSQQLKSAIKTYSAAERALSKVARADGLRPCDEDADSDRCNFPICLAYGCEGDLAEDTPLPSPAANTRGAKP